KAVASAADALILDLEDSVAPEAKAAARDTLKAALAQAPVQRPKLFVRINDLETGLSLADLAAVMPARPDAIALPKCRSVDQVRQLGHYLDAFET
ncbi:aldolase/citrate lyase family protein, partial [Klebsiella pneumoniae]